jgi:hypothetical protein
MYKFQTPFTPRRDSNQRHPEAETLTTTPCRQDIKYALYVCTYCHLRMSQAVAEFEQNLRHYQQQFGMRCMICAWAVCAMRTTTYRPGDPMSL